MAILPMVAMLTKTWRTGPPTQSPTLKSLATLTTVYNEYYMQCIACLQVLYNILCMYCHCVLYSNILVRP